VAGMDYYISSDSANRQKTIGKTGKMDSISPVSIPSTDESVLVAFDLVGDV